MEKMTKSNIPTISVMGTRDGVGRSTLSINIASLLAHRGLSVIYGTTFGSSKAKNALTSGLRDTDKDVSDLYFRRSKTERIKILSYGKNADKMSPKKIEDLIVDMPRKLKEESDCLIFNIRDPFGFPDRYILLHTTVYIVVAKVESSVFSDIFQQLEKLAFMPTKPSHIYVAFNYTRDIDRAFETYLQIIKQAEEFGINIKIYFLGIIPDDPMRQVLANKMGKPLCTAFPESPFTGAVSFMADKLINVIKPQDVENEENLPIVMS